MLDVQWGSATDVGLVRSQNQDSFLTSGGMFAVADGMGGHAAGEVASALAIEALRTVVDAGGLTVAAIAEAVAAANAQIVAAGAAERQRLGLGTTLTGTAIVTDDGGDRWAVFNVGDSRVYRFADGLLTQLTVDHSEVQDLIDIGAITLESARTHPRRNVVTRWLGSTPAPLADVWVYAPVAGDRFLVCSDGLTDELLDREIALVLQDVADPAEAALGLVQAALDAGGHDNVTAVVVDLVGIA